MCRYSLSSLIVCVLLLAPVFGVNAQAETVKSLTDVTYVGMSDRIEFSFLADESLKVEDLSARTQGSLLVLRLEKANTTRRWISIADASVKRVLVHPSKKRAPAANLRIRFHQKVAPAVVRNIRVRAENGRIVAAVPRNKSVALSWEGTQAQGKVQATKADIKPATVAKPASKAKSVEVVAEVKKPEEAKPLQAKETKAAEEKTDAVVEKATEKAEPTEELPEDEIALNVEEEQVLLTNEMADGVPEGPGMGAVAMSFLLVLVVGVFLWRRMRTQSGQTGSAPMIRTIGSHMLGPKQGLLLVDVAGEMVLLGTSDKGVQLLTKIESTGHREEAATPNVSQLVTSTAEPVPTSAMGLSERMTNGLGKVIDRLRQQAAVQSGEAVGSEPMPEYNNPVDTYRALVKGARQSAQRQQANPARRDFAPVTPAQPKRLDEIEPPLNSSDDLLNKLRNLQSA